MSPSNPGRQPDRRKAERAAEALRDELGLTTIPVDAYELAKSLDIHVQGSDSLAGAFSGCLIREGGQFGILYNTAVPSEGFRRFTVSHEIGHHQMPWHAEAGGLYDPDGTHRSRSNFTSYDWREAEADAFAVELLMPRDQFQASIRGVPIGRDAVRRLAETFSTSRTSTAIRYATVTPDPVAVIVSESGRVLYCFSSEVLGSVGGIFLRKGTPIPTGTATARLAKSQTGVADGEEEDGRAHLSQWFEKPGQDFEVLEDALGLGSYGKILTILHATEVPFRDSEETEDQDDD